MKRFTRLLLIFVLVMGLTLPVSAYAQSHIQDDAGVFTPDELLELESYAANVSQTYDCGVYFLSVADYFSYPSFNHSSIFDFAWDYYHQMNLGMGNDRNGIILVLDVYNREVSSFVYGQWAEYALDDYGLYLLEEAYLPSLQNDWWYDAAWQYIDFCNDAFADAAAGEPIRESNTAEVGIAWIIAAVIAGIYCGYQCNIMKTARVKTQAEAYVSGGLNLKRSDDVYLYQTVVRTPKSQNNGSSSGGRSHSGGGGHGRSSKF